MIASFRTAAFMVAIVGLSAPVASSCPHADADLKTPSVGTIAGSGAAGSSDGPSASATFMDPAGVAIASDGSIYVADSSAQNIRRIRRGVVTTVAGGRSTMVWAGQRTGGFANGPAAQATFNRPTSLAVAPDGTIWVADAGNHAIRRIKNGTVTTFAGGSDGSRDGKGTAAQFTDPEAVADDTLGNLYVADRTVGIRKISADGTVTTLDLPDAGSVCGLDVRANADHLLLAYTTSQAIHLAQAVRREPIHFEQVGSGRDPVRFDQFREPATLGSKVDFACNVAILNDWAVAITDTAAKAVRFIRFNSAEPVVRTLAGGAHDGEAPQGGFRDGASSGALTYRPTGIAAAPDGTIVFADTGNRRIRSVRNVDARGPLQPGEYAASGKDDYRISVVGSSITFWNVMWNESVGGQIEGMLSRDGRRYGLDRCPSVGTTRLTGSGVSDDAAYISNYLADGETDLVVLMVNETSISDDIKHHPDEAGGNNAQKSIARELEVLHAKLTASKTAFLLVVLPERELFWKSDRSGKDYATRREDAKRLEAFFASTGIKTLGLLEPMEKAEARSAIQLYYDDNRHTTPAGSRLVGQIIAGALETWKPWNQKP